MAGQRGVSLAAAAVAVTVAAAPWLSRPWRRTAWIALAAVGAARLITGTILPAELVVAFASGVTVGAAVLVAFGVPDRRMGPDGIGAALRSAGLPVVSVEPACVQAKSSRPFVAVTDDGRGLFIKALGSDQRDADLLYRAYRFARLRNVGDTWPAASVIRAVEHQALVAVMAERAGVRVPPVDRVVKAGSETALLVMDRVEGSSLGRLAAERISDDLLQRLWAEVHRLHHAGIAHRSLRAANVMVGGDGLPWLTDFSFSELAATQRQQDLDLAELLASLAILTGADRAVSSAAAVIGTRGLAPAVPLLQPLALSAATRHAITREDGLLAQTRSAAAAASELSAQPLAPLQRVRPRTLLAIAAAAGAFYFILPQLAQVSSSWHALQSAHWAWLPVIIAFLLRRDLPGQRGRADRRRARPGTVLAHHPDAGRLVVRQPGLPRQRRQHGAERPVPAEIRRPSRRRRRGGRSQRPDGSRRSPDPAGHQNRGVETPALRPGRKRRFTSPEMSAVLASVFACLGTGCTPRPPSRRCCGTTAATPGTCGTSPSSSTPTGTPAARARRATWSSAGSSPKPGRSTRGWPRAPRRCSSRRCATSPGR